MFSSMRTLLAKARRKVGESTKKATPITHAAKDKRLPFVVPSSKNSPSSKNITKKAQKDLMGSEKVAVKLSRQDKALEGDTRSSSSAKKTAAWVDRSKVWTKKKQQKLPTTTQTLTNLLRLTPKEEKGPFSLAEMNRFLDEHPGFVNCRLEEGKQQVKNKKRTASSSYSYIATFQGPKDAAQALQSIVRHSSQFTVEPGERPQKTFLNEWEVNSQRYDRGATSSTDFEYPSRVVESLYIREAAVGCTKRTYLKRFGVRVGGGQDGGLKSSPSTSSPSSILQQQQQQQPKGSVRGDYLENTYLKREAIRWLGWSKMKNHHLDHLPLPHSITANGVSLSGKTQSLGTCDYLSKKKLLNGLVREGSSSQEWKKTWGLANVTCRCDVRISPQGDLSDPSERRRGDDKEVFTVLDALIVDREDPSKLSIGVVDIIEAESQGGRVGSKGRNKSLLERIALDKCLLQLWVSQMSRRQQKSILEALTTEEQVEEATTSSKADAVPAVPDQEEVKEKVSDTEGALISATGFAIAVGKQGQWTISEEKLRQDLPKADQCTKSGALLGSEEHGREVLELGMKHFYLSGPAKESNFHTFDKNVLQCVPPQLAPRAFAGKLPSFDEEPDSLSVGSHCSKDCPYLKPGICLPSLEKHSICNLGGIDLDKKRKLWESGARFLPEMLQAEQKHAKVIQSIGNSSYFGNLRAGGNPTFNKKKLRHWFQSNLSPEHYPLIFIDFEAVHLSKPPRELIEHSISGGFVPFQYSMDVFYKGVLSNGSTEEEIPEHFEFLAIGEDQLAPKADPRSQMMESLVKDLLQVQKNVTAGLTQKEEKQQYRGTFLAHHVPFDSAVVKALVNQFEESDVLSSHPELHSFLKDAKWVDTIHMLKHGEIVHPDAYGSNSLKRIFPALCPEEAHQSYAALSAADGIADGLAASSTYKRWFFKDPDLDVEKTRSDMLKYCGLDTRAMWQVVKACGRLLDTETSSSNAEVKGEATSSDEEEEQKNPEEPSSEGGTEIVTSPSKDADGNLENEKAELILQHPTTRQQQ